MEVVSAVRYERVARLLVARLKFCSRLALAQVAADAMVAAWDPAPAAALVPVPASPRRERARGFDAASLLARLVAARAGVPVAECLARHDARRQFGRRRAERLAEPPAISATRNATRLPGGPVWIVDDVTTTGATLLACRRALHAAGATDVRALTFARAC
jgi:ComF family protein